MSELNLDKSYDPKKVEEKWYRVWEEKGYFEPTYDDNKPKFSLVIPPPNVTGVLHIGHALNNTIQDVLARYKRMDGYDVLWVPGTDHAGIATQNVVEREIAKEGLTRQSLGREKFIERVWSWKERCGNIIIEQLKKIGASCSWSYQRFTMDEGLSKAVREVFVKLWEEGLIYRGDYIINWCPRCGTALADLEVEMKETQGKLWYLKYPLEDGSGFVVVATTRPETMLGDTAVAVNPEDERYKSLIGKFLVLPLLGRKIPIIADKAVDPEFGTGAVKVTPAHDFADFDMAKRHNLPLVKVIGEDGFMTEEAGPYKGLERYEARKKVLEDLKAQGFLEKEEDYKLVLGHCYRCDTVIEPLVSKQWFVSTKPLAQPAMAAVEYGFIKFIPENWTNLYFDWMKNIRDWCISRQIWWGHRIPVWYCKDCNETIVSKEDIVEECPNCGSKNVFQDEDVLDTWFSSALWPFSTMGWPEKTQTLTTFYPTSVLVTSFDIIFFWVARMIMMGIHFMGQIPFHKVYIHALVRDEKGQKMSKSRGNVIDPLLMVDKYGADALRFTLIALAAQGRDIKLSEARIEGFKHFINKIWNASRFVLMNLEGYSFEGEKEDYNLPLWHRWILSELQRTVKKVREKLEEFEFDQAAMEVYHFFWGKFCDWFLEVAKVYLKKEDTKRQTQRVLIKVLTNCLKLLHPFIPFVTEEIWAHLTKRESEHIIKSRYPEFNEGLIDELAEDAVKFLQELTVGIRNIKAEYGLTAKTDLEVIYRCDKDQYLKLLSQEKEVIEFLAKVKNIKGVKVYDKSRGEVSYILSEGEVLMNLGDLIDSDKEIQRLTKEKEKLESKLKQIERKLSNKEFLEKAPKEVVEKERQTYEEIINRVKIVTQYIYDLKGI
ncbi:valine--tRNA ligase [Thermodesulfobacterium sp. TA1]|uniref:valine--tRNA ligase n=1 Tax=Thermodesulfobacterium sp. TA1 TaxID=2234087 RepID=UPI0012328344|nr:valine--tRNA ligase [Thermodesulfobacterium sp. TA1]QER42033.1 valine--tRNA ligase [Thermodesulfobacterium sp. TA1]